MSDPPRYLDDPTRRVAAKLMRAGLTEAPPREALARALSSIGAGVAAATVEGTSAAALHAKGSALTSLGVGSSLKWTGGVIVAGLLTHAVWTHAKAHVDDHTAVMPAPPDHTSPALQEAPAAVAIEHQPELDAVLAAPIETAKVSHARAAPRASDRAAQSPSVSSLADEVSAIDRARRALARHDPETALSEVERYRQSFPGGKLGPEALDQKGEHARASLFAKRFLAAHPDSPHASRLEAVAAAHEDKR